MALAETARLATELTLKDNLSPGLGKSQSAVGRFDSRVGRAGKSLGKFGGQLKTAGAVAGGVFAGGVLLGIKTGLTNLGELESATTSVEGAIKRMGKTGKVTAGQVAEWANQIEEATQAAFDDKEITAASANLIRYGHVTVKNLRPAMVVMTDLAARTGSVDNASKLLAKALADPTKATGVLRKAGVVLTAAQEKQIKSLVKAGKTAKAQEYILRVLSKSTKGAAAAMNGPYVDAQRQLDDAVEDGTKLLAVGFLPLITKLSGKLRKLVSDPKVQKDIKAFGEGLASGFDKLVTLAEKVPWGTIADGLKKSAEWAGKLFDAFRSLPPEAQATIVALAGLNKISGGAVTGIVSELGKGLIKGVLGMTAGVVNLKAGVVNGGGGGVPGGGGGSKGGRLLNTVAKVAIVGVAAGVAIELGKQFAEQSGLISQQGTDLVNTTKKNAPALTQAELEAALNNINDQAHDPLNAAALVITNAFNHGADNLQATGDEITRQLQKLRQEQGSGDDRVTSRLDSMNKAVTGTNKTVRTSAGDIIARNLSEGSKARTAIQNLHHNAVSAINRGTSATRNEGNKTAGKLATANAKLDAIRHKKTSFRTIVNVRAATTVSVRDINKKTTTSVRFNTRSINQAF